MIFGVLNPEKIWHQQLVQLPTSPVYCSHFFLNELTEAASTTYDGSLFHALMTLRLKKTTIACDLSVSIHRLHGLA